MSEKIDTEQLDELKDIDHGIDRVFWVNVINTAFTVLAGVAQIVIAIIALRVMLAGGI